MDPASARYTIRINGHLGATVLSAFPALASRRHGAHTLLTGVLDRSALYGVLTEIEALGLDLLELRQLAPQRKSAESGDRRPGPGARREPGADGIQPGVGAVGANARLNPKAAAAARGSKISRLGKPR